MVFGVLAMLTLTTCAQKNSAEPAAMPVITGQVVTAVSGGISNPLTPVPPTPATIEPAPGGQIVITRDDGRKTLNLNVGDRFLLNLGEGFTWEVTISDPAVLDRVKNITVIKGAQGVYEALRPGTVSLQATGDPLCRQSQPPCAAPSILFEITVVVK